MKADQNLWHILNDKLEVLRASNQTPEALRVAESALDLAKRAFPEGATEIATSLERLGQLHDQQGDSATARKLLKQAHTVLEQASEPDHRALYRSARRLALLCDHLGRHEEAIGYYEQAIRSGSHLPDLAFSDLGTLLNNVALIYRKTGHPEAAEPYYLQALEYCEKQLGPEHADVASVLNNLAVFYTNQRRFREAEEIHLRALTLREKAHPPGHPDIAQSKCNLAVVYHSTGDYQRAAELYRQSMQVWEEANTIPGKDYEIVASNYADLLRSLGKARRAQQVESRAKRRLGSG